MYPSGNVCLSILDESKDWVPTITVQDILRGIQDLLSNPNLADPAQREAFVMARDNPAAYSAAVKKLAASCVCLRVCVCDKYMARERCSVGCYRARPPSASPPTRTPYADTMSSR